tara:strand:- start:47 stop:835 length:789 start_codon:yes stop_codon:yes gene_type:complete
MTFNRLNRVTRNVKGELRNCNFWTSRKDFSSVINFDSETILKVFQFSFDMTFGEKGVHRAHRSGGTHYRKNGELFINTFQGKIAEFGIYNYFLEKGIKSDEPDLATWGEGKWDTTDLVVNGKKLNVKSTKSKGHLLLLETKDWNEEGKYIPNLEIDGGEYDYFILARADPDGERIMKDKRLYFSNDVSNQILKNIILNVEWKFDIVGFITINDLINVISEKIIIKRGEYLNQWTRMDAENYYVQSGDMNNIDELIKRLKSNS